MMSDSVWCLTLGMILVVMYSSIQGELNATFSMKGKYSGSFSSPGYPKKYPKNVVYKWIFPDYTHDIILIKFSEMDLYLCYVVDPVDNCDGYDQVIVEGHASFCNWRKPPQTIILDKQTNIWFRTFNNTKAACRGKGFNATFEVASATIYRKTTTSKPTTIVPIKDGRGKETTTKTSTITIIAVVIVASVVITIILVCILCWRYKKHQQQRRPTSNRASTQYSSVPADQNTQMRYSELLRRSQNESPSSQRGPPPTYDSVVNPGTTSSRDRQNINTTDLESPPSYATVMRETSPNARPQAGGGRRHHRARGNETRSNRNSTEQRRNQTNTQITTTAAAGLDSRDQRNRTLAANIENQPSLDINDQQRHTERQEVPTNRSTSRENQPTNQHRQDNQNTQSTADHNRSQETNVRTPIATTDGASRSAHESSDGDDASFSTNLPQRHRNQTGVIIDSTESSDRREVFV